MMSKQEIGRLFKFVKERSSVRDLPILLAVLNTEEIKFSGEVFDNHVCLCKKYNIPSSSKKHVSQIITNLCESDLIDAVLVSRGKYGRTRQIKHVLKKDVIEETLEVISGVCNSLDLGGA